MLQGTIANRNCREKPFPVAETGCDFILLHPGSRGRSGTDAGEEGDKRDRLLAGDKRAMESWRPSIRPSFALFSPPRSPRLRVIISNPTRAEARRRRAEEEVEGLKVRAPPQSSPSTPGSSRPGGRVPHRGDGNPAVACSSSSSKHVSILWKSTQNMLPLPGEAERKA